MVAVSETMPHRAERGTSIDLTGMRVLVVGLAQTGVATARFLSDRGATVMGTDIRGREELEREFPELKGTDMELYVGTIESEAFLRADLIVVSPGVPPSIPPLTRARERGVPIVSEIEMASWFVKSPIVAVTGTNGKTTTTRLIGDMLEKTGKRIFVGGNIGNPMVNLVPVDEQTDLAVVELSSFQLEAVERFRPAVALLLNLTEDHLDRYANFGEYVEAKSRLFVNQKPSDVSILNGGDPAVLQAASSCRARKIYFNARPGTEEGAFSDGRRITVQGAWGEETYDLRKCRLIGGHNTENMMAAVLAARLCGCPQDLVQETLETFEGLPHRLEFVRELDGVSYVNDSKGTNVGAVVRSLQAFTGSVILIGGGKDKGGDYAPLRKAILEKVKHLILIGEARERMGHELGGAVPISYSDSLEGAVKLAHCLGKAGDTVLLSPACSSYDMFRDYEERGDTFKALVAGLRN